MPKSNITPKTKNQFSCQRRQSLHRLREIPFDNKRIFLCDLFSKTASFLNFVTDQNGALNHSKKFLSHFFFPKTFWWRLKRSIVKFTQKSFDPSSQRRTPYAVMSRYLRLNMRKWNSRKGVIKLRLLMNVISRNSR